MSETASLTAEDGAEQAPIFTAYEIDFMLGLRDSDSARVSREQIGLRSAPEEAREFVTAAVTSGLRARGKVERSGDGQWLLGGEGQAIAAVLTSADRWLGIALAEGEAMRMAFLVAAGDMVVMLTQDALDSFVVTSLDSAAQVPGAVSDIVLAFLEEGRERTVSLRRTALATAGEPTPMMFHVEADGTWKAGHLPLDGEGVLTVSPVTDGQVPSLVGALWEQGASPAP